MGLILTGFKMPKTKFCQNPLCHLNNTDDRFKKGVYQTRKLYGSRTYGDYFCTRTCLEEFWNIFSSRIMNFIGITHTPINRAKGPPSYTDIAHNISQQTNSSRWGVQANQVYNFIHHNN